MQGHWDQLPEKQSLTARLVDKKAPAVGLSCRGQWRIHTHTNTNTLTRNTHTHTHTHTQCMYECMAKYTHGKEKVTMFLCMCVYRSVRFVAQLNRRDQLLLANASPTLAARARCVSFYPSWSLSIYLSIYLSIHAPAHFTTHSNNGIQTHWPTLLRHLRERVCVCSCRETRGTISTVFSLVYPE